MSVSRAWLVVSLLACAAPARADDDAAHTVQAKEIYRLALADFNAGRFGEAMEKFAAGYALSHQPLFLYNAAQSARRAGRPQRAVELFRQFLSVDPNAPERAEALKVIGELAPDDPPPLRPLDTAPVAPEPPPVVTRPAPAPAIIVPAAVVAPLPARPRWWRDLGGGVMAGIGGAALLTGIALTGAGAPALGDAGNSYQSFDTAHRAQPLVIGGSITLCVGAALAVAATIRYTMVARRLK